MFITFKEILEYSLENCLSLAALIREGENYYHELLEANWVSDGMWWGRGGIGYLSLSDCGQNKGHLS